ncbi:MAG TPA: hypothetical protein VMF89_20070, partial [Polyangiales bacterium]|nr:hypothetical protein [Polyangiales bacterium]
GATALHTRLLASDALLHEAHKFAEDVGGDELWIEKLQVHTAPEQASLLTDHGVIAELIAAIGARRTDRALLDALAIELSDNLGSRLPPELREGSEGLVVEHASFVDARFDAVLQLLAARLQGLRELPELTRKGSGDA